MPYVRRKPLSAPLLVRRGKPLQPTPRCREAAGNHFRGGDGLRPAGLSEVEHSPAVRQRFARRDLQSVAPDIRSHAQIGARLSLPLRGEGGPLAVDEVIPPNVNRFGQKNHRKPEPGAGECRMSVESVGQGNQQSPAPGLAPHPPLPRSPFSSIGEGLSAREREQVCECPTPQQRFARRILEDPRPTLAVTP